MALVTVGGVVDYASNKAHIKLDEIGGVIEQRACKESTGLELTSFGAPLMVTKVLGHAIASGVEALSRRFTTPVHTVDRATQHVVAKNVVDMGSVI